MARRTGAGQVAGCHPTRIPGRDLWDAMDEFKEVKLIAVELAAQAARVIGKYQK